MLRCPTIKPHLKMQVVDGTGVFVLSEARQLVLQGELYELVVPELDGRPLDDVCRKLADRLAPSQVIYTVRNLEKRGFLCEQEGALSAGQAALWSIQNVETRAALERLAGTTVGVRGLGVDVAPLISLLGEMGVQVADEGELGLVLTDGYLNKGLQDYNRQALEKGLPWLLAKPVGGLIWIGPIFQPGAAGCWECLARRIRSNFPVVGYLDSLMNGQGTPAIDGIQTPATLSAAWGMIAGTVANWIASEESVSHLAGAVQTVNLLKLSTESHVLAPHPTCPACGQAPATAAGDVPPVRLESCRKTYTEDGGHRATSPEQTLHKYERHVSPICGAVTMLERSSPPGDGVMHVYVSGNNVARGPQSLFNLRTDLRSQSAGKGMNAMQAKASALCEGLERYSGVFSGDEPRVMSSFRELGELAIHPNACMLFSDRQLAERDERNATSSRYGYIPQPFDPDARIDWTPVWSLTHDRPRYLPTQFCYFSYPAEENQDFCIDCSNGNAAGNSLEEAVLQGFLELVERDAVGVWWYNRVQVPGVDLDSFGEPYLDRLRTYLKQRHRELWALDLTGDLGIPVFAAVSRRTDGPQEQIMFGFGAHLDPRIALLRAATEMNQMLTPILDSPPDGPPPHLNDEDTLDWLQSAVIAEHAYLLPKPTAATTASTYSTTWTDDLKDDVVHCRSVVENLGLEMLVHNQTRVEIGMPVVKVIVPGLRHFWSRFAPGRLYDVPVKLNWLERPRAEEELNPVPMFL